MKKKFKRVGALTLAAAMAATLVQGDAGKADAPGNYSYFNDYTLGWNGGITAYKDGKQVSLEAAGASVLNNKDDNVFAPESEQAWDTKDLVLTQPVQFTTNDGKVHDVESMLTNFDFIADPTAIDNSAVDGKLYVYGTTEGFTYKGGTLQGNGYDNHSLTILSTTDMVNWTDEGFMDTQNLTNEPSDSGSKTKAGWAVKAWAPSGLAYDGDGDGDLEYYLFHTNSGAVGYVMSDSPTGPWRDPLQKTLFTQGSPNCSGVVWCFDPAVLVDDKGDAYVYFGGGTTNDKAHGKTGRVCKIGFKPGTGEVVMDGEPQEMDTYYMFEDSEINQFNGLYYYSYCANFNVPGNDKWTKSGSIAVYVSSDPMDIAFDPAGENGDKYTDENGVYHHYLGTVLDNPSTIYGESYNNHHHMQSFKGHDYIFYHSTVLNNVLYRDNKQYRCLHVDEINVDKDTDAITITPSYEGASQIENFNPYTNFDGSEKVINATTTSYSAGVSSRQSDSRINNGLSPMVLDNINTGDWTKIQGVDFGNGAVKLEAEVASETDDAAIEVFLDDPTKASNYVGTLKVKNTGSQDDFQTISTDITAEVKGVHDVYFVFRGTDYDVATWKFTETTERSATPAPTTQQTTAPAIQAPAAQTPVAQAPVQTPAVDYNKTYTVGNNSYKISAAGTATYTGAVKKTVKSVTIPNSVKVGNKSYKITAIAAKAFKDCKKLKSVTIGKNVKSIGAKAFYNCKSLKKITVKGTALKSVGKAALKNTASKLTIKVPAKKAAAFKKIFKGKGQSKKARIK
mgnify:FL=1